MPRIIPLPVIARLLCVAFILLLCGPSARACTTPVWRYALDNWAVTPYVVLYFHADEIREEDKAVNDLLTGLAEDAPPTNLIFFSVRKPKPTVEKPADGPTTEKTDTEKEEAAAQAAEDERTLGEHEMRFSHLPRFVRAMYQLHVLPELEGERVEIELVNLPELGDPIAAVDEDRVDIAPPKRWSDHRQQDSQYIVRFQPGKEIDRPAILVTAEDYKPKNVSEKDIEAFAKKRADVIEAAGAKLTRPVTPIRVGDHWGIAYASQVKEKTGEGENEEEKTLNQIFFETVVDGRKYTYEMRGAVPPLATEFFAVVGRTRFSQKKPSKLPGKSKGEVTETADEPFYLIVTPWQTKLYAGQLDKETIRAMVDSPVRRKLGKLIEEGHSSVLLVLNCPDEKQNERAAKVVGETIAQVKEETEAEEATQEEQETAEGESPAEEPDEFWAGGPQDVPQLPFKVASLTLSRTDETEKWLVDSLLAIEPDLHDEEFADEVMIFAVFGRGLALPPYIGKGITSDNLIDCMFFLSGPCSCQVKDMNPGMDLLMKWDWEATAEALAEAAWEDQEETREGAEGEEIGYEEIAVDTTAPKPGAQQPQEPTPGERPEQGPARAPDAGTNPPPRVDSAEGALPPEVEASAAAVDTIADQAESLAPTDSFAAGQAWKFAIGLAVAAAVVLAAGFALMRH